MRRPDTDAVSTTPLMLDASAGLMVGLGLSGVSFGVILGVVGRAFPPSAAASHSHRVFRRIFRPVPDAAVRAAPDFHAGLADRVAGAGRDHPGDVPLAAAMMEGGVRPPAAHSNRWVMRCAKRCSFRLLVPDAGFFVCGFQVAFISVHLPAYLLDVKMTPAVGATALALIGLFNIAGSFCRWLSGRALQQEVPALRHLYSSRRDLALFLVLPVSR